ncbi:hypothetical protein FA15DRAFT_665437 [Coprinopsis marcescibilis]|uniref:Uncharacterized protein n=1 Tax=Coprinopsis marcescibilis TaxID=230819 RepID=A0A5C3LI47_COPMA|nr:hypothetical protein FA15DRAFT_665437 [Coprinopsis marcescibilis]
MPKGQHHCADPKKKGCNGMVISGANCPKCKGYTLCAGGCGQYTAFGGTCPACQARQAAAPRRRSFDDEIEVEARSYDNGRIVCFRTL